MTAAKLSILDQVEDIFRPVIHPTPTRPLRVLIVGAEVAPYASVGGISKVISHLSRALNKLGHDARVFMPKYGLINEEKYRMQMVYRGLKVPTGDKSKPYLICNVKMHRAPGRAPVYFLENREYYELRANVYGYKDDPTRFALLSRGVIEFLRCCSDWTPDVIEAMDWQAGHLPNWLRTEFDSDEKLVRTAVVFSIHNLQYQGIFDHRNVSELNYDDGRSPISSLFSQRLFWQNFMRRGIMYGDVVNTVSKSYAKEILTSRYGEGLDKLLTEVRSKLIGILNGIDYDIMNPGTDQLIKTNYDIHSLDKRVENKLALQEEFDLVKDEKVPLLGHVGRLEEQKGLDLTAEILHHLLEDFDAQFVIVGGGSGAIADTFRELKRKFPKKVGTHLSLDFSLSHLVFAGSDIMLFPSRFEPCGLVQMEAMRYGSIPLVRAVGGLADTVQNYDPEADTGWGFVFQEFNPWAYFAQVVRALEIYRQRGSWRRIQKRAMRQDNSWEARAQNYVGLFRRAIAVRKQNLVKAGELAQEALTE